MTSFGFYNSMKHYFGKIRTIRNEVHTERVLNALPPELRSDIGWPERRKWK